MCTSGCPTQDCPSYAACLRGKGARVAYCNSAGGRDYTAQKKWDRELNLYADARRQGIEPDGTKTPQIRAAIEKSDQTGEAYKA